mgnify:FL=1
MYLTTLRKLLNNNGAQRFLSKPYGLELLFVLDKCKKDGSDNGIDDTFDLILFNKPRRKAFGIFVDLLWKKSYLIKSKSKIKASKSILRLSNEVLEVFKKFKDS